MGPARIRLRPERPQPGGRRRRRRLQRIAEETDMPRSQALLGLAAALLVAGPALAHHSFAMFDRQKEVTLKGTVKEFQWTNPHSFIEIETPDDKGGAVSYSIEMNSPNNLTRQGWKSTALKAGDKVTVVMNPLR